MPQPVLDTHAEVRKLKQAGCQEEQAEAMVDLVNRAPVNAQIARTLEQMQFRLESIESGMANMATKAALDALTLRLESIESGMANMATKAALDALTLRLESIESGMANMATKADLESLRADMTRMLWVQALGLATLIISLAGMMLYIAGKA